MRFERFEDIDPNDKDAAKNMTRVLKAAIKSPKGGKFVFMRKCEKMDGGPLLVMSMPGKKISRNLIKDVRKGSKPILGTYHLDETGMVCFHPASTVNAKQMTMAITRVGKLYKVRIPKNRIRILEDLEDARIQSAGPSQLETDTELSEEPDIEMRDNPDSEFTNEDFFSDDETDSNIDADIVEERMLATLPPEATDEDGFLTPLGVEMMRQKTEEAAEGAAARQASAAIRLTEASAERQRLETILEERVTRLGKNRAVARKKLRREQKVVRLRKEVQTLEASLEKTTNPKKQQQIQARLNGVQTRLEGLAKPNRSLDQLIDTAQESLTALMAEEREVEALRRASERAAALEEARLRIRDESLRFGHDVTDQDRERELSQGVRDADAVYKEALQRKHAFEDELEARDETYVQRLVEEMKHAAAIAELEGQILALEEQIRAINIAGDDVVQELLAARREMADCKKKLNRFAMFRPRNAQTNFDRAIEAFNETATRAQSDIAGRQDQTDERRGKISKLQEQVHEIKRSSDEARDQASQAAQDLMRVAPAVLIEEATARQALSEAKLTRQRARVRACTKAVGAADQALQAVIPNEGPVATAHSEAMAAKKALEEAQIELQQKLGRFAAARAAGEAIQWSIDGRPLPADLGNREAKAEDYARGLALLESQQQLAHDLTVLRLVLEQAEANLREKDHALAASIRTSDLAEVQAALAALEEHQNAKVRAQAETERCNAAVEEAQIDLANANARGEIETSRAELEAAVTEELGAEHPPGYAEEIQRLHQMDILTQRDEAIASIGSEEVRTRIASMVQKVDAGHQDLKQKGASPVLLQELWQNIPRVLWDDAFIQELQAWRQMEAAFAEESAQKAAKKRKMEASHTTRQAAMAHLGEAIEVAESGSETVSELIETASSLMDAIGDEERHEALEALGKAFQPVVEYSGYVAKLIEYAKGAIAADEFDEEEPDEVKRLMMEAEITEGIAAAGEIMKKVFKSGLEENGKKVFGVFMNVKDMVLAINGIRLRQKKVSQDLQLQRAAEHARLEGDAGGALVEALQQSITRERQLAREQVATAVAEAAEAGGSMLQLTAVATQAGAGLTVAGKSIKMGIKVVMKEINWSNAARCKRLADRARGGDRKSMVEIFKHSGKYAKGLLAQMCLEDSTIAINYVISRNLTETMIETSSPEIIRLYLLKEANEEEEPKTFTESMNEILEIITGAFSTIGDWCSSIGSWLSETEDETRLRTFANGYPAAEFARVVTAHTRAVAGLHQLDSLDDQQRLNVEENYVQIREQMAMIHSTSQEKLTELIQMRQAMERNLAADPSRWTPKYIEKIQRALDTHLATHTATMQQLVDSVAAAA